MDRTEFDDEEATAMTATPSPTHPWVTDGARRLRFGVGTFPAPAWALTRDLVQTAEGLGFDSFWIGDHPLAMGNATWTTLAALATATETIRLGPLVACASYWNPVVLARAAADVDRLSGGRVVLGLGSGDMPAEFAQLGLAWPPAWERQASLAEALRIIRPLLRGETVDFEGERFRARGAALTPPPVQQPYVPLLVAGGGRSTLRLAAEFADACNLGAASWAGGAYGPDDARRKFDVLQGHCAAAGRAAGSVLRTGLALVVLGESAVATAEKLERVPPELAAFAEQLPIVGTPEEAVPRIRAMVEAGFQYLILFALPFDTGSLRLLAERVIPAVTTEVASTAHGRAAD